MSWDEPNLTKVLMEGGIAVMPTDTLYGIVGQALNKGTVERIYTIRKRAPNKPCIILIGSVDQLDKFSIHLEGEQKNIIKDYWAVDSSIQHEPVSIVLDCLDDALNYLHRGTHTLAFRLPSSSALRDLLLKTGPLVAPSANPEGLAPAQSVPEAQEYFGDSLDLYIDGGVLDGKASKIIKLQADGAVSILRP